MKKNLGKRLLAAACVALLVGSAAPAALAEPTTEPIEAPISIAAQGNTARVTIEFPHQVDNAPVSEVVFVVDNSTDGKAAAAANAEALAAQLYAGRGNGRLKVGVIVFADGVKQTMPLTMQPEMTALRAVFSDPETVGDGSDAKAAKLAGLNLLGSGDAPHARKLLAFVTSEGATMYRIPYATEAGYTEGELEYLENGEIEVSDAIQQIAAPYAYPYYGSMPYGIAKVDYWLKFDSTKYQFVKPICIHVNGERFDMIKDEGGSGYHYDYINSGEMVCGINCNQTELEVAMGDFDAGSAMSLTFEIQSDDFSQLRTDLENAYAAFRDNPHSTSKNWVWIWDTDGEQISIHPAMPQTYTLRMAKAHAGRSYAVQNAAGETVATLTDDQNEVLLTEGTYTLDGTTYVLNAQTTTNGVLTVTDAAESQPGQTSSDSTPAGSTSSDSAPAESTSSDSAPAESTSSDSAPAGSASSGSQPTNAASTASTPNGSANAPATGAETAVPVYAMVCASALVCGLIVLRKRRAHHA